MRTPFIAPLTDVTPGPLLTPEPDTARAPSDLPNRDVVDPGLVDAAQDAAGLDWAALAGYCALVMLALALTAVAATTLWWMLYAWRSKGTLESTGFSKKPHEPVNTFTLLVPGRHEEEVMGQTLDTLAAQTHPRVQIIAIVGHDDPGTEAVARDAAARHPDRIEVVVDDSVPKNKPKALNRALPFATGDVVGVFDAEDEVHPDLLRHIDSRFTETGAVVVQGGVQLMNFRTSWWSLRNVLEYYFWFRSRLHFHAGAKFIPLGGNTVFVRREALERNDGWDPECLAEDCELGVRLSSQGAKVVVAYSPEYVTREETPGSLKSLYKQRTRWNQGFLQVLRKGEWRALPHRSQRMFARYMLAMPFLQAATGLLIPLSVCLILFAKVPTVVALLTFIPLAPTLVTLAVEVAALGEFGRLYGQKVRARDYARLVLGTIPFQVFLAVAAIRSVFREVRGARNWEKTEHTGAHRESAPDAHPVTEKMVIQRVAA
ncbi:Glycosyltransferase, catalytic subunit of cellulose synthase and poly-beta-1,6-N-acetylglucosamine synthase [Promicromonospora umidemergens]|uniref:Cellulose synthase/poly-beta-1,6-N-acetylglucosamine synthase-like glycosyltransferase n=1 Tax=Promicromonospora umidemergens TaxID=629679 RepID=A0ABP8XIT5_9MICO|nr:glycosyltransferase [Promicromonospora umidemergens]MCP2285688.1 Glycosyltransferase, catalytic subunit of cellulose synthase and poly-beta-1,6-N-acetylglucosamine synthase [Promicromonospora umidemergens]